PPAVAPVDGLPAAVPLGHVPPLGPRVEHPDRAVEDGAVIGPPASPALAWQQRFDPLPRLVGQLVSTAGLAGHTASRAPLLRHRRPPAGGQSRSPRPQAQPVHTPNIRSVKQNLTALP